MKNYLYIFSIFILLASNSSWAQEKFYPLPARIAKNTIHPLNLKTTAPKFFPLNNASISKRAPMAINANRVAQPIKTMEELPPTPAQNKSKTKIQLSEDQAKQILSLYAQND